MATFNPFVILPTDVLTDRSRTISYQECPRRRFLNYHFPSTDSSDGVHSRPASGIQSSKLNIPLATGTWTHHGLAALLEGKSIEVAVEEATKGYWAEIRQRGLALETGEDAAYVADEQCALVEGMLRGYAHTQLLRLTADYEVLETEKEEIWEMADRDELAMDESGVFKQRLIWMARADGLLLERASNELYVLSYKTSAGWDSRREREANHDMQGLSELAAIEFRLYKWWEIVQQALKGKADDPGVAEAQKFCDEQMTPRMVAYLRDKPEAPRVAGVKMEYLLKGDRYADKSMGGLRTQRSPLIRGYRRADAIVTGDPADLAWKYEWQDDSGKSRKLAWQTWKSFEVWKQPGGVKAWVELLSRNAIQPDAGECLPLQVVTPVPYFRHEDDLRDWFEQTVSQEWDVASNVMEVLHSIEQNGWNHPETRSMLNLMFRQHRRSCDWPSPCPYQDICYGSHVRENPIGSGMYIPRKPHHEPEMKR